MPALVGGLVCDDKYQRRIALTGERAWHPGGISNRRSKGVVRRTQSHMPASRIASSTASIRARTMLPNGNT